ncbi:uncharacterized protein N7515_007799 [Penicillium bovifimosum]|uniref:Histone-lysine N-methyltransferase, H3 lysine-36 specific n=1 Tax=Penicillium bovifimosum TaxID=126998 RepID=A0A9W9GM82_9EURO|nr:uncharacterized protein N7515_007799 [Penicillium bovifimosum]KAJ5123974.1 hypothetical protein N7515_007799 [Penicillium bovifimosum]
MWGRQNRRRPMPLPEGWFAAEAEGRVYYYSTTGATTWERPTLPALPARPTPAEHASRKQSNIALQSIIDDIMNSQEETPSDVRNSDTPSTPHPSADQTEAKPKDGEKWRKLPLEKQKRIYENTLFPIIKPVVDSYKNKIPRDDLKRFAKEISKKMVESDYKKNRVTDPTVMISAKHEKTVKGYCKSYFQKAAEKHAARAREKSQSAQSQGATTNTGTEEPNTDTKMSGDDTPAVDGASSPMPYDDLKRKRGSVTSFDGSMDGNSSPYKQQKSIPPPPPPPPPPAGAPMDYAGDYDMDNDMDNGGEEISPEHNAMEHSAMETGP